QIDGRARPDAEVIDLAGPGLARAQDLGRRDGVARVAREAGVVELERRAAREEPAHRGEPHLEPAVGRRQVRRPQGDARVGAGDGWLPGAGEVDLAVVVPVTR